MFFVKDQLRQNNIISPLAMSRTQNRLDAKEDSSSSVLPNGEMDEVEIEETTHDAFVKEFPKPSYSKSTPKPEEGVDHSKSTPKPEGGADLNKQIAEVMLATIDPDIGFLASLLPHMRSVSGERKALLKNHLLQVVLQYCDIEDIDDKDMYHDESETCSGSEDGEASHENHEEPVTVNKHKRKLLVLRDSDAKKSTLDGSVIIKV